MDTQPETNPLSQTIVGPELDNRREAIAATQHKIWAHWMEFLFKCCESDYDGRAIIPADLVKRWKRQIGTEYECLKEWEKESDREQADKILDTLKVLDTKEIIRDRCKPKTQEEIYGGIPYSQLKELCPTLVKYMEQSPGQA